MAKQTAVEVKKTRTLTLH